MSVKDVKAYYDEVCQQRQEMLNEIHDFEEECQKGLIEPERLDQIKETIQPLLNNYQTLSYIMFLLNKPVKKSKQDKYLSQNKKFLKQVNKEFTKEGIKAQNQDVINTLKGSIKV
jgi:hypothetical protein